MQARIRQADTLPEGFDDLVRESLADGFSALRRMGEAWKAGKNRFDRAGEGLWVAADGGRLLGVCGLNVDPYLDDPTVARVRHLYVALAARRLGIGRALVETALAHAERTFRLVRVRTTAAVAARLYESLGFAPPRASSTDTATHVRSVRVGTSPTRRADDTGPPRLEERA